MNKKSDENNSLADYVSRIMEDRKLSSYDVQRQAKEKGYEIDQSSVFRIKAGKIKSPSPEKLIALAVGLGVTEESVFSVVRKKSPNAQNIVNEQFQNLSQIFEKLSASKKLHAQILIDMIEREFKILANEK